MSLDDDIEVTIDPRRFAGISANAARIDAASDEFTIDFARVDARERRGMVVARLLVSPQFMREFLDDGEDAWQTWVDTTMPPEVHER